METRKHSFDYLVYPDSSTLPAADQQLLSAARKVTAQAYAPYSRFHVGAVILLSNGSTINGTNQENASYPAGICAERVALSAASAVYPGIAINTIAVSYHNLNGTSDAPISPCGICRQSLAEYENRQDQPIRIILSGQSGKVFVLETTRHLLPFVFTAADMK